MRFRTFSPVVGSLQCDGRCPFCVAKMTPAFGLEHREPKVDWEAFDEACRLAKEGQCSTVLLSGNGEPTLFPKMLEASLARLNQWGLGNIELQTNGMQIALGRHITRETLERWHALGLKTIAISAAHYDPEINRQVYCPYRGFYPNLPATIGLLKSIGFTVRLTCIMFAGGIDTVEQVEEMLRCAEEWGADQLTLTPMNKPDVVRDENVYTWAEAHQLSPRLVEAMANRLDLLGELIKVMTHGARLYRLRGLSVCLSNCLTQDEPGSDDLRNIIFFPTGWITTNWEGEGELGVLQRPGTHMELEGCVVHASIAC